MGGALGCKGRKKYFCGTNLFALKCGEGRLMYWRNGGVADEVSGCGREGQLLKARKNQRESYLDFVNCAYYMPIKKTLICFVTKS